MIGTNSDDYEDFIKSKVKMAESYGFEIAEHEINQVLMPHQKAATRWLVAGGRRAGFLLFGLGKTIIQLETVRITLAKAPPAGSVHRGLIICPLGVREEFARDAVKLLGWDAPPKFIRTTAEASDTGIFLTNYESVREGKVDPAEFIVLSLDEASILRGFGSTKTFRELMRLCTGDGGPTGNHRTDGKFCKYRFVATATPSPNEYIELLAYAEFLGIMDVSQAKTRFFKRDSTKADNLTLHAHKEREFWLWVASWALFVQKPSDLGFSDEGYALPPLQVLWHEVETDHRGAGHDRSGQGKLLRDAAIGVQDAASEKRSSLPKRLAKLMSIVTADAAAAADQLVVWCDLNDEQVAIEREFAVAGITCTSLTGSQDIEEREQLMGAWRRKETTAFVSKPSMYGAGINLQQCHTMVFLGIGFKFYEVIQAIHRIYRFLQLHPCTVHLIFTEAEREIRKELERKWTQHNQMVAKMTDIIREFGLSKAAMASTLTRKLDVTRIEVRSDRYRLVNNDCVLETRLMETASVGFICSSIPFSTQYEYSPSYLDFGHSEGNTEFFHQKNYLTPELLRILKPGRVMAIHVKDRIVPGGMTGLGFQTVYPFHAKCIEHYTSHGFGYMGMITVVTDVVRENNQTYRLSYTEQCKDGTKMGVGMPEYVLLFRKPPTDNSDAYADERVAKSKRDYSLSRWQVDAHGFWRSSGNRLLQPEELTDLSHAEIFQLFRAFSLGEVYDFKHHVRLGDTLREDGRLPVTFMLLQPQSHHPEVWTDVTRMLTLNGDQYKQGKTMHLCPMQLDLADRLIERFSQKGDVVFDMFGGLMTVPYRAMLLGRIGWGCELNPSYFVDGCGYCKAAEEEMSMPTLFDVDRLNQQPARDGYRKI